MDQWPGVSVLLPVLDEAGSIDGCVASLLAQDYPGGLQLVIADGGSADGTPVRLAALAAAHPGRIVVVDNPRRLQAHGLNLAAGHAAGEVLVRADAHTTYAPDYVRRSVAALSVPGVTAAGGRLAPAPSTPGEETVALALRSPLATGPARFHHADRRQEVDTVYLGAWRRADFLALGGFRALPSGAAEDADFYWRMRRAGGRVVLDPAIRSAYRPRGTLRAVARQHWRYGVAKAEMLWLNGEFPSWRPLAPLALVAGLAGGAVLAARGRPRALCGLSGAWATVLAAVAAGAAPSRPATAARVAAVTATMQLAYGAGLARGLLRGAEPVRHLRA